MAFDLYADVVPTLERSFPFVREELEGLDLEKDFLRWPQSEGYKGIWSVFALFFEAEPYLPVDIDANRRRCPRTAAMLDGLPRLVDAGFSLVGPQSAIFPHSDNYGPDLQRLHLGVLCPDGSEMIVDGQTVEWEEVRVVLFDHSLVHSVTNESDRSRVVLLCDFRVEE